MRVVQGFKEENVIHIFPEGEIKRYDLTDAHGRVEVRNIPIGSKTINFEPERIASGLVALGLIKARPYVVVNTTEEIDLIDSNEDTLEYSLKLK